MCKHHIRRRVGSHVFVLLTNMPFIIDIHSYLNVHLKYRVITGNNPVRSVKKHALLRNSASCRFICAFCIFGESGREVLT